MKQKTPIGFVNFDGSTGENNEVEIKIPLVKLPQARRGHYVLLEDQGGLPAVYLGRIVRGPFYQPDAVSKDSAFARASILEAEHIHFKPDYHGVCTAEILGETDTESFTVSGTNSRPLPQAAVLPLTNDEVEKLLQLQGDVYFGELTGYEGVRVYLQNKKHVFPRNVGIFGTVGSGKTNTSQVLIEELSKLGWAVIVLDPEGEYIDMDIPSKEATTNKQIIKRMVRFGIEPKGIKGLTVRHCIAAESNRKDSKEFGIRFDSISAYMLAEILNLSPAQQEQFLEAHHELFERNASYKKKSAKSMVESLRSDEEEVTGVTLVEFMAHIESRMNTMKGHGRASHAVILRKLRKLQRSNVFDTKNHLGDCSELLKPGHVNVFDVSTSATPWVNNIVISTILSKIFELKDRDKDNKLPPVMVMIEEAHTFVSKEKASTMQETLDELRKITRKGRKRWLGMCFITQQPSHLPAEIYELCNTKFVHQTTGTHNLDAIKNSSGGVNRSIWDEIPVLGQGRCLVISPQFRHPLMVDVRPCTSERRMTQ